MPGKRADGVRGRTIPLHDDLWQAFKARAAADGLTDTGAVRELLTAYVDGRITIPAESEE